MEALSAEGNEKIILSKKITYPIVNILMHLILTDEKFEVLCNFIFILINLPPSSYRKIVFFFFRIGIIFVIVLLRNLNGTRIRLWKWSVFLWLERSHQPRYVIPSHITISIHLVFQFERDVIRDEKKGVKEEIVKKKVLYLKCWEVMRE